MPGKAKGGSLSRRCLPARSHAWPRGPHLMASAQPPRLHTADRPCASAAKLCHLNTTPSAGIAPPPLHGGGIGRQSAPLRRGVRATARHGPHAPRNGGKHRRAAQPLRCRASGRAAALLRVPLCRVPLGAGRAHVTSSCIHCAHLQGGELDPNLGVAFSSCARLCSSMSQHGRLDGFPKRSCTA